MSSLQRRPASQSREASVARAVGSSQGLAPYACGAHLGGRNRPQVHLRGFQPLFSAAVVFWMLCESTPGFLSEGRDRGRRTVPRVVHAVTRRPGPARAERPRAGPGPLALALSLFHPGASRPDDVGGAGVDSPSARKSEAEGGMGRVPVCGFGHPGAQVDRGARTGPWIKCG